MATRFVPLRSFIYDRLYHPKDGYFCRQDFQVGQLAAPIDFKSLIGFDDYQEELAKRYPRNAWLTPSEIFKPYYGMSIGNYVNQAHERYSHLHKKPTSTINIVEAGAGTGSTAESILYYFQNFAQQKFQHVSYEIIEISPSLCKHMHNKLKRSFPRLLQNGQIKIKNQDIATYRNQNVCFMLFFEVLDNLPHDKVIWDSETESYSRYVEVDLLGMQERYEAIGRDQLIKECLQLKIQADKYGMQPKKVPKGVLDTIAYQIYHRFYQPKHQSKDMFLPTYLLKLMKQIRLNVPKAQLLISDFDSLPSSVSGQGAPIVSRKGQRSQDKKDYDTYLVGRGEADIFFPVNFRTVVQMHQRVLEREAEVIGCSEFFEQFGHEHWATSRSGFNPIRQDFMNTSFLVSKI